MFNHIMAGNTPFVVSLDYIGHIGLMIGINGINLLIFSFLCRFAEAPVSNSTGSRDVKSDFK